MALNFPWLNGTFEQLLAMRATLPHALLLHGPAGTGKSALAAGFAAALLCESPAASGAACGACAACGWLAQSNHPDLRLLAPGSDEDPENPKEKPSREIKIGQVRALGEFLSVGGHRGGRKVVLIDPADALNVPAANALLKTLEEPPGDTVFLLVTSRADALAATVRSRCVAVPVPMPPLEQALRWLLGELGTGEDAAARAWLAAAGGAPLRARVLAEPSEAAAHRLILKSVAAIPENGAMAAADAMAALPARTWLPVLQAWVGDLGRTCAGAQPRRYPDMAKRLAALAGATSLERIAGFDAWLAKQAHAVEHPLNARLFCEDALLHYREVFAGPD